MAKCLVHGCESDGFEPALTLSQRRGDPEFLTDVIVCGVHRDELSAPNAEWSLLTGSDWETRELFVGMSLRQLNEHVVLEAPTAATPYALGGTQEFSAAHEAGFHVSFSVRQRGKEQPETLALLMSREMLLSFADQLQRLAATV
ncbi:hypothetical protein [Mycobacterium sp. E2462]|uniref:hypothetical protein n=1 Tax=Mycobacterium sp. E2462 TaxID=1834133 RepID=UPI0012E9C850|nr:hypothetical protein [Mycobacterium sp. E2462]